MYCVNYIIITRKSALTFSYIPTFKLNILLRWYLIKKIVGNNNIGKKRPKT